MNVRRLLVSLVPLVALASCRRPDPPRTAQQYYYPPPPPGYYYPQQTPPLGYPYPTPPPPYPPQPAPPAPRAGGDRFAAAREQCVTLTNGYRARVGVKPLVRRHDKEACADAEAASDGRTGEAHGAFGICKGAGAQNECPGWPAGSPERSLADCLESMFQEGPGEPYSEHGHYLNMTAGYYTGVACGFAIDQSGSLWIVQDFF